MNPSQLYLERVEKIKKTIAFENSGVTTTYMGIATPAKHMSIPMKTFASDPEIYLEASLKYINEINSIVPIDCINSFGAGGINVLLTTLWLSKVKMPGRELPDDSLWQVDEKKIMEDSDYDLAIEKGYAALSQKILPKVIDMNELMSFVNYNQLNGTRHAEIIMQNNYPVLVSNALFSPPFEVLCGARSMSQFFMDCYKLPEKVKDTLDAIYPELKSQFEATLALGANMGAWIGGWRGASALVSPKIWDNFVWPYMYDSAMTCIKHNVIPIFHLDQNWDRDIERFKEMPAKSCVLNTDGMTNLANARKKLGEHAAFMGDVPAPLLATGSVHDVKDYVNKLLDDIGPKGVFITAGCDAPQNAKFENMVAMFQAASDYK